MASEVFLDTRDLEPPEPLVRALAAVRGLQPGQYLRMIHRREPCLLFPALEERGFEWRSRTLAGGEWEILAWPKGDPEAHAALAHRLPQG